MQAEIDTQIPVARDVTMPMSRPVRICVVGSGRRFLSGISYYTHHLATALTENGRVSVILMRRLLPAWLYPGRDRVGTDLSDMAYPQQVSVYDGVDWYWGSSIIGALRFLLRERPEVVVLQWWTGTVLHTYLALTMWARLRGSRVVMEFHETLDPGELGIAAARAYVKLLAPLLVRMADGFVVHSEFDRRAICERYQFGDRPVMVIPHGPYDQFRERGADERPDGRPTRGVVRDQAPDDDHGAQHDVCRLLYFGVIRPFKGVEDLVRAFDGLAPHEAELFHLTVVGETWESWTLPNEMIAASPYRHRIDFVNRYVTDQEVQAFFRDADLVVLPYHRSSASGPLHVAMSHGLPVVVTAVGGLIEATRDYDGARLVPPRNAAELRDAIREMAGLRGRRFHDPHSWRRTSEQYEDMLNTVAAARDGKRR